jgi:hypothetical protein
MLAGAILFAVTALSTTSFAAGTHEQRRACRADAMKFCGEFVPNVDRITACMKKNVRKLSPLCRKQFR